MTVVKTFFPSYALILCLFMTATLIFWVYTKATDKNDEYYQPFWVTVFLIIGCGILWARFIMDYKNPQVVIKIDHDISFHEVVEKYQIIDKYKNKEGEYVAFER